MAAWIHGSTATNLTRFTADRGAGIRKGLSAARRHGANAAATLTLREYRDETELALESIVEVMCAHEAEIADLRRQVVDLNRDLCQ